MKRELRISAQKDYIAVDYVNGTTSGNHIESTPFYLAKDKPIKVKSFDAEENKWMAVSLLFDGEKVIAKDIDPRSDFEGMDWEIELEELLDAKIFKP